jgi:hypothetical protein
LKLSNLTPEEKDLLNNVMNKIQTIAEEEGHLLWISHRKFLTKEEHDLIKRIMIEDINGE